MHQNLRFVMAVICSALASPGVASAQIEPPEASAELSAEPSPDPSPAPCPRERPNRPPVLEARPRVEPHAVDFSLVAGEARLRVGRPTVVSLIAEDPDGDPLVYGAERLPAGARFDPQRGVLSWTPNREQVGRHIIEMTVSDGQATTRRDYALVVHLNRAPASDSRQLILIDPAASEPSLVRLAGDSDADVLTFEALTLPPGAHLVSAGGSVHLSWRTTKANVGTHDVVVDISDGEHTLRVHKQIVVVEPGTSSPYLGWLLPGAGPSGFLSSDDGELFLGGAFDVTLLAVRSSSTKGALCASGLSAKCYASHYRFYGEFEVLESTRAGAERMFTYGAGFSASFEHYPARRYLIPHYGVEVGGLFRSGFGHRAQTRPYLGVHLWSSDTLWLNATFGYRLTPAELDDLSGPTVALRAILKPF